MNDNLAVYTSLIEAAKEQRPGATDSLRSFLKNAADKMPPGVLIDVSEIIRDSRRDERRNESRLN
ncbi:hypothetical protein Pan44_43330 [Caulifigura coniformis]|uniref:Uncharacterized protein n=1 Tax=Caulifigura coniformis TaxID=2527983 RepID=A0A517SJH6_9PLAN|nr:hypothetical protein Pan44_43330 [Caulifigura coniformis]